MIMARCLLLVLGKAKQNKTNRNKTSQGVHQDFPLLSRETLHCWVHVPQLLQQPPLASQSRFRLVHSTNIPFQGKMPKGSDLKEGQERRVAALCL